MTPRAFLSLGANVGDRERNLGDARAALISADTIRLVSCSAVVETDPVDVLDQPRFLNQVLGVDTSLVARALVDACLAIEHRLGRDRAAGPARGPRTIDVDLLLYGGQRIAEDGVTVPHPRLAARPFFLELCRQAGAPPAWLPPEA